MGPDASRARKTFDDRSKLRSGHYAHHPLGGPCDAVVSALSIHHLSDELKRDLFARIFAALRPGGIFINAEQVLGLTAALEEACRQAWLTDVRALGASEAEIDATLLRMQEDRCAPLEAQLQWLREAAFEDVDCWFKEGRFAVYSGRKPS